MKVLIFVLICVFGYCIGHALAVLIEGRRR